MILPSLVYSKNYLDFKLFFLVSCFWFLLFFISSSSCCHQKVNWKFFVFLPFPDSLHSSILFLFCSVCQFRLSFAAKLSNAFDDVVLVLVVVVVVGMFKV